MSRMDRGPVVISITPGTVLTAVGIVLGFTDGFPTGAKDPFPVSGLVATLVHGAFQVVNTIRR